MGDRQIPVWTLVFPFNSRTRTRKTAHHQASDPSFNNSSVTSQIWCKERIISYSQEPGGAPSLFPPSVTQGPGADAKTKLCNVLNLALILRVRWTDYYTIRCERTHMFNIYNYLLTASPRSLQAHGAAGSGITHCQKCMLLWGS